MTFQEFDAYMAEVFQSIQKIGATKGAEYANGTDRLANFKRLASRLDIPPEAVCMTFGTKHIDSLDSVIKTLKNTGSLPPNPSEPIQGRIHDAVLYFLLLGALMKERA